MITLHSWRFWLAVAEEMYFRRSGSSPTFTVSSGVFKSMCARTPAAENLSAEFMKNYRLISALSALMDAKYLVELVNDQQITYKSAKTATENLECWHGGSFHGTIACDPWAVQDSLLQLRTSFTKGRQHDAQEALLVILTSILEVADGFVVTPFLLLPPFSLALRTSASSVSWSAVGVSTIKILYARFKSANEQ